MAALASYLALYETSTAINFSSTKAFGRRDNMIFVVDIYFIIEETGSIAASCA